MASNDSDKKIPRTASAQPRLHQRGAEIQAYNISTNRPSWLTRSPKRIQLLGGVSIAMAADIAETTQIERPPRGGEDVPVQLSRLLDAHQIVIRQSRKLARRASELGDDGTNDLVVSEVLRGNELQVWFVSEHLVDVPLIKGQATSSGVA